MGKGGSKKPCKSLPKSIKKRWKTQIAQENAEEERWAELARRKLAAKTEVPKATIQQELKTSNNNDEIPHSASNNGGMRSSNGRSGKKKGSR